VGNAFLACFPQITRHVTVKKPTYCFPPDLTPYLASYEREALFLGNDKKRHEVPQNHPGARSAEGGATE
jgi:hypothetical protein